MEEAPRLLEVARLKGPQHTHQELEEALVVPVHELEHRGLDVGLDDALHEAGAVRQRVGNLAAGRVQGHAVDGPAAGHVGDDRAHLGAHVEAAAKLVGARLAQKARAVGIETVAFDRGGYRYHGRVKALADAAREAGLKF